MHRKFPIIVLIALIITAALITAAVLYGKDFIARSFIERTIKGATGLRFSIGDCIVSILNSDVRVKDLAILNPKDFQDKIMLDIVEIYADFDTPSLLKRKPYLKDLRINIDEIYVIKDKEGRVNLEALTVVKASQEGKRARDISEVAIPNMQIDSFELKIKKVVYKDYTQLVSPMLVEKEVNINERYEKIQDPALLIRVILVEAIKKAALEQFLNINLQALSKPIAGILSTAQQIGKGTVSVIKQTGKQITEAVKMVTKTQKPESKQPDAVVTDKAPEASKKEVPEKTVTNNLIKEKGRPSPEEISPPPARALKDKQAQDEEAIAEPASPMR